MFRRGLVKGKVPGKNNEPEYEEVGPPIHLRKNPESRGDGGQNCDLCGSAAAAVRCDRCGSQAFCLSCDDMYHRHPRRSTHVRKAVDTMAAGGGGVRPPLPPKLDAQVSIPPPQPPPRKNKRAGFLSNSGFSRKDQPYARSGTVASRSTSMTNLQSDGTSHSHHSTGRTIMGSLKRIMGARPLPPTPTPLDHHNKGVSNDDGGGSSQVVLGRTIASPSLPNLNDHIEEEIRTGLPQSVLDMNHRNLPLSNTSASTPVTPASAHAQYPPLQPKSMPKPAHQPPAAHTHSLGRKFSLQQLPQTFDDKRTSMVEPPADVVGWEGDTAKPLPRNRSQSVSDDQWAQMMGTTNNINHTVMTTEAPGPTCPPGHTPADMSAFAGMTSRRSYNTMTSGGRGGTLGRGMVSSASVCDLNSLSQQQQQQQQQSFNNTHAANSFQQLNMMGYPGGVMWGAPCELCQAGSMFSGHPNTSGMKRTASNLSMNLSSVGSDMTGYPWAPPPPHVHHHMPMYPGYYPGYHPQMAMPPMGAPMGLNMSIPDSMHTFGKVPSSPAPSVRSTSHRSHKSSKSRSFSAADSSGRRSRNRKAKRSEESEESRSSSGSEGVDDVDDHENHSGHGNLAWQCDHCTFINNGGTRSCGMCSKTIGASGRTSRRGSERRRSDRRRDRRTDHEDDDRNVSEYENDDAGVVKSNLSFNIKDSKRDARTKVSGSNKSKNKKKSRQRSSSASGSGSGSEGEEERLEKHMRDLKVSSSSRKRGNEYDGVNNKDKDKEREKTSRKKEGSGRFKNRGRSHSERARTPGRQTPRRCSPVVFDRQSMDTSSDPDSPEDSRSSHHNKLSGEHDGQQNSLEDTLVDTLVSEVTLKTDKQSKSDNSEKNIKSKGSKASKDSTPAHSDVDDEPQQKLEEPVVEQPQAILREKSRSPSPRLRIKSKSPPLSQRMSRGDVDPPSFANTLDDVVTMATNEVADQDLGSQYVDEVAPVGDQVNQVVDNTPIVNFIRPQTPEDIKDEPKTIILEPKHGTQKEPVENESKPETKRVDAEQNKAVHITVAAPEPVDEPSYELIEEPNKTVAPKPDITEESPQPIVTEIEDDIKEPPLPEEEIPEAEVPVGEDEGGDDDTLQEPKMPELPADIRGEVARSASSGSSLGLNSPPERQYTPLSFSSSDAQFYSPPDSPDISLSEQLQDKPGQAERQNRALKWGEEDLSEKYLTVEEIITKRRQEAMRRQGLQLVQILRDAEEAGYTSEDVSIALTHCGDKNPLEWLRENWRHMVDTVSTLATNYGQERRVNDVGSITATEARAALRMHKGNIWAAVTECVEQRQKKFSDIYARGKFRREEVVKALQTNDGDADKAFNQLNKSHLHPFLTKIWHPQQVLGHLARIWHPKQTGDHPASSPATMIIPPPPLGLKEAVPPSILSSAPAANTNINANTTTPANTVHQANNTQHPTPATQAPLGYLDDTSDDDDIFENTYANIEPLKTQPPKVDQIYAKVRKGPKPQQRESDIKNLQQKESDTKKSQQRESDIRNLQQKESDIKKSQQKESDKKNLQQKESDIRLQPKESDAKKLQQKESDAKILQQREPDIKKSGQQERSQAKNTQTSQTPTKRTQAEQVQAQTSQTPTKQAQGEQVQAQTSQTPTKRAQGEQVQAQTSQTPTKRAQGEQVQVPQRPQPGRKQEEQTPKGTSKKMNKQQEEQAPRGTNNKGNKQQEEQAPRGTNSKGNKRHEEQASRGTSTKRNNQQEEQAPPEPQKQSRFLHVGPEPRPHQTRTPSPDLSGGVEDEELFSASEVVGLESDEGSDQSDSEVSSFDDFEIEDEVVHHRFMEASQAEEEEEEVVAEEEEEEEHEEEEEELANVPDPQEEDVAAVAVVAQVDDDAPGLRFVNKEESDDQVTVEIHEDAPDIVGSSLLEPGMAQTRTGPVTFQKASVIVGKAIAKAMAREVSARESLSRSATPEIQEAPVATPEPSEDEDELEQTDVTSDSSDEDEDHRTLDTIPEEGTSSRAEASEASVATPSPAPASSTPSPAPVTPEPQSPGALQTPTPSPAPTTPEPPQSPVTPQTPTPSPLPPKTPSPLPEATPPEDTKTEEASRVTIRRRRPSDPKYATKEESIRATKKTEVAENVSIRRRRKDNTKNEEKGDSATNVSIASTTTNVSSASTTKNVSSASTTKNVSSASTTTTSTATTSTSAGSGKTPRKSSLPEYSGESEGEDGGVRGDRVSLGDHPKIPHLLVQIEGLKARQNKKDPDYQEMRELKEQIQLMRRELEAKMEDGEKEEEEEEEEREDTPETPPADADEGPTILLHDTTAKHPPEEENEQLQFDRTVRRLLAEGRAGSYEKAELAAQLLTFSFDETDSLQAAEECSSIYTAIQYLQQECELCAEKYPMKKMVSMLQCIHRCCAECAKTYFTFQIKTKNIREVRCPFCNEPDLDANEETANEYLNNMDILLKNILDGETHELFQRKLRDWTLMKDPNFRWCNKCSSGFIANPRARKLICPDCKDITCAQCRASWEGTHEGISCTAFAKWKADNSAEVSAQGVARHLAECGITCPKCKFTYSLAKGGCMHFTCTQCKFEFCSGCGHPFRQGKKCSVGPYCERLGLHAHHPRNCLFYLRDKEPLQLQNLLKEAGVNFDTELQGNSDQPVSVVGARPSCQVQEQKELPDGLKDDICGRVVPSGYAGLCRLHYTEYLVEKINTHKLDPVGIFDEADLRVCLRRNGKTVPIRRWESEKLYREKLIKLIKEHLPLRPLE